MISCREWWPWTKPGYISMTQRQSNNQWSGGIAAHHAPKIPSAKIRWKSSCLDFLGSRRHPPHWLSSKGPNYRHGVLLISAGAIEGYFEGKTPQEGHQGCTTMSRLTWHLKPIRNWPTCASYVFITHPNLQIWPHRTTTCSLDWKNNWKVATFHPMWRSLLPQRPGWTDNLLNFFLSGLQKLEQWAKKCFELRGEYVE